MPKLTPKLILFPPRLLRGLEARARREANQTGEPINLSATIRRLLAAALATERNN